MGRKKRKVVDDATALNQVRDAGGIPPPPPPPDLNRLPVPPRGMPTIPRAPVKTEAAVVEDSEPKDEKKASSGYAMVAHSAEIIDEDIYVSDGSEDDEEENQTEILLVGSRMGVMRRGIHHPMLVQPNRQWKRQNAEVDGDAVNDEEAEQKRLKEQEEELAKLDPAQRAARLLAEKQRKLDEAKEAARRLESEENAGRDPCLFSKRTAFDIRFDQIDDKPWARGAGDMTDFFNYGLTEEDWLDYAEQQLMIRQELTDASRQRRPVDPTVVPVTPKTPHKQTPKVAVAESAIQGEGVVATLDGDDGSGPVVGPVLVKNEGAKAATDKVEEPSKRSSAAMVSTVHVGAGGAWGAGAAPGSMLAKLIEEQEKKTEAKSHDLPPKNDNSRMQTMDTDSKYGSGSSYYGANSNQDSTGGQSWNDHSQQGHQDWNQNKNNQQDWNNRGSSGQHWNQHGNNNYRNNDRGGRGYYGGRGGRGGRGGYHNNDYNGRSRDRSYHSGSHRGGGDYQQRKRQRDDYDDRRRR